MIKLIIETPGLFLDIPGITPCRTPATIDVTKHDVNRIISGLRKYGVEEFRIVKEKDEITRVIIEEKKIEEPVTISKEVNSESFDRIEKMLKDFMLNFKDKEKQIESPKKLNKIMIEDDNSFIPTITNLELSKRGNDTFTTEKSDSNIEDSVNALRNIKKIS